MGSELKPLRCPYCGAEIEVVLEYVGHGYSSHREHVGFECADYLRCNATWTADGTAARGTDRG